MSDHKRNEGENHAYRVAFQTLGCKVNQYETDAVRKTFLDLGFVVCEESENPDVVVINTCTVTSEADRKSRQMIRRAGRRNPNAVIAAMGCQVEMRRDRENYGEEVAVGTKSRDQLAERVLAVLEKREYVSDNSDFDPASYPEFGPVISREETRAVIKIQDGCDNFCSYCIIPFARGRIRSRDRHAVLEEARLLAAEGFSEIVLTGIHVCSYGRERGETSLSLAELVQEIDAIPGIERIRVGSLEPSSLTVEFVRAIAGAKKLCPHFHVSLQSGSDSVLSRMNRKYTSRDYESGIRLLRESFEEMSLTTDIIVGFPGETDAEHRESLRFAESIGFTKIHVFPYSERIGTRAASFPEKVPARTKLERRDEFLLLSNQSAAAFAEKYIGRSVLMLIESDKLDGWISGYTPNYIRVHVRSEHSTKIGETVPVLVESVSGGEIYGRILF